MHFKKNTLRRGNIDTFVADKVRIEHSMFCYARKFCRTFCFPKKGFFSVRPKDGWKTSKAECLWSGCAGWKALASDIDQMLGPSLQHIIQNHIGSAVEPSEVKYGYLVRNCSTFWSFSDISAKRKRKKKEPWLLIRASLIYPLVAVPLQVIKGNRGRTALGWTPDKEREKHDKRL